MKRPKVTLENQQATYDYFEPRNPDPLNAYFLHWLFGKIYEPQVGYAEGAEEKISNHFSAGGLVLLAASHASAVDPLLLASLAQRERALQPLRANAIILGKAPIFKIRPIRPFIDNFVAMPAYRGKDATKSKLPPERAQELRESAAKRLISICIDKADEGKNIAIFPNGTRKGGSVRSGIGQIACGIENPEKFLILPIGIDPKATLVTKHPNIFVGTAFELSPTPDEVTAQVEASLQSCVASATQM